MTKSSPASDRLLARLRSEPVLLAVRSGLLILARMRVWQVTHYGEPEEMALVEMDPPTPEAGQVLIRNRACGLNFFDLLQCQGKYQARPEFPFTIGAEVAGTVDAVSKDVRSVSVGQRVASLPRGGGFAEFTLVKGVAGVRYS